MYQSIVKIVQTSIVMVTRPLIFLVIICFGFIILLQSLVPKVMALKRSKANEFTPEDQRTRQKKNYITRLAREHDLLSNSDNIATSYDSEAFQSESSPEEVSVYIVDYANMIHNDVNLLDNSIEARIRKRGNIREKKFNQAIPDVPCNCEYSSETKDFGNSSFPRFVETRNCNKEQQTCLPPYICQENLYNITILRKKEVSRQSSFLELPIELKHRWIAEKRPISVGCACARDYLIDF